MKPENDPQTEGLGLLANGSSGCWDLAVDEFPDGDEWLLEIDGPQTYLAFQLEDLNVLPKALRLLQAGPPSSHAGSGDPEAERATLHLGRFGSASVSLRWDNEDFPRCFLVIGPQGQSTLHLSLEESDIRMLGEALQQVVQDLPLTASM